MAPGNRKAPTRAKSSESQYSLMEFTRDFPDDETCLRWLWTTRYAPDGEHAHCPRCDATRAFHRYETKQQRQSWTCTSCSLHIHPTAGTIFHKSSTALHLWFYAMYLMTSTRCGISAKQLERELGVTYKTAWRMFTLIRNELMGQEADPPLTGEIEMDEMYVGGKPRQSDRARWSAEAQKHGELAPAVRRSLAQKWSDETKTQVWGAVERGGRVQAHIIPSRRQPTIMAHVVRSVDPDAVVYTDSAHAYGVLRQEHHTVDHHSRVYVSGDVHTQTIDGFWSLVKRGISGTHHAVSPKWLQGYLNEYVWRYNRRDSGRAMFLALILRAAVPVAP
ncbi:MAG TPA: IS1595 family transposase [Acidimicrobiales bacterium]|nr:IS1595 family transposase [Acidimicrobiales bacterium]